VPAYTVELLDVSAEHILKPLHCFTLKSSVGLVSHTVIKSIFLIIDVQLSICGMSIGGREQ
jgi:hypothetical protein